MLVSPYKAPILLFNPHLETIVPSVLRRVELNPYLRERIVTPDNDFLDLDWLTQSASSLVIISHGLEGNSSRPYVKGMARAFFHSGFDVLAWNYRGCSEEMNKTKKFYHSGATDDLLFVIRHALKRGYAQVHLIGFSLGGNLTLKLAGEMGKNLPAEVTKAVAFSVPMHLHSSCLQISRPSNWIYSRRFLRNLKQKIKVKSKLRSDLSVKGIDEIKTLIEFDDQFTAPLHGFASAVDYYEKSSSLYFLDGITIPTLIVNAANDPFLSETCYPKITDHPFIHFESPSHGGHVGFSRFGGNGLYWSELRALDFILPPDDRKIFHRNPD